MAEEQRLVNIWEDTVDLRQLLIGIACGSALGFASYAVAIRAFTAYFPDQAPSLIRGYALMAGIAGCVTAAAIIGTVFKPKRILRESEDRPRDRPTLIRNLGLDLDAERRALATASPKLIREMQQLQIHDLFVDASRGDSR